jgi:hypothetical protein
MANEFKHKTVGTQLTQSEYEAIGGHVLDSQAAGDIIYASSTTQLSRLGIGTAGKLLAVNSGATAPEYVAAVTGVTSVLNTALVIGRDADNDIDFATDNNIIFRAGGADQIKLIDGALLPVTDDDVDLGSSSLQFKDGYFDGTVEADAITVGGTSVVTAGAVTSITSLLATDIKIGEDDETKIDFETADEIHFYANNVEQVYLGDNIFGPQSDSDVDLGSNSVRWKDAYIDTVTTTGDVTVGGDLTITGDDLVMGTNTSGHLLIADGTNFNPTAVGDLSEISSVASDDVLLAVDTSGGGLKKITRSTLVSGLATSSGIANVADDSTPQLGGDLDVDGNDIVSTSNGNISLLPNGSGKVIADGNGSSGGISLSDGVIDIRTGTGSVAKVLFYCESSNAHAQTLQAQPHSAGVTNTLTLPAGGNSTLVSLESTDTLTNKTLTSPKINEDVAVTSTATEINILDGVTATTAELNILDGVTATAAEINLLDGVSGLVQADFTKLAAIDATAAELNIMDGNTTVGTTAVADGDGIVTNDGGTMKQTSVETFATYFGSEITSMSNLTSVGTLTTLTVDNVITNGTTIGHTDDTDLMTLADGVLSVAGNLDVSGSVETATIDFTDGDNALTIADGGGVTFPQAATFTGGFTADDDINLSKQKVIKIGGSTEAHDFGDEHSGHGITITMEAGAGLTEGKAVYVDSNGKAQHPDVDHSSVTGKPAIGIAMSSVSSGATVQILTLGIYHDDTYSFSAGSPIIITGSSGALTTTASDTAADGDIVQRMGVAITSDTAFIMPSIDEIEHAG